MTDAGDRPETLSRREMIAATAAALAAPLLPVPAVAAPSRDALQGRFLTPAELALLDELTELIIPADDRDRKSTRLNSSHLVISYAVFCLKKKKKNMRTV